MKLGRLASALALSVSVASGACSHVDELDDGDDGTITTGVADAGSTGSGHDTTDGSGGGSEWGTGGGGNTHANSGAPYPIVLAHGFFGFEDFAGVDYITYFFHVKEDLAANGETMIYTPAVDPFNDSEYRGAQLIEQIEQIKAETGKDKVVIIGHSQGGLDARVVAHDRPDLVAAVITVATPHGGTPIADIIVGLVNDPNFEDVVNDISNLLGAALWDAAGNETGVMKPLHLFSKPGIDAFNAKYPAAPGIFYASIAGRTHSQVGGQACVPDVTQPFISKLETSKDPVDPLFYLMEQINEGNDGELNDALVPVKSAHYGEFWGCVPADHLDEIGQLFGDGPGGSNKFDHKQFYRDLVAHVRQLGY